MFCWNCTCAECESKRGTCYLPMPYARCAWCAIALPYAHKKPYCVDCENWVAYQRPWNESKIKTKNISAIQHRLMMREAQE